MKKNLALLLLLITGLSGLYFYSSRNKTKEHQATPLAAAKSKAVIAMGSKIKCNYTFKQAGTGKLIIDSKMSGMPADFVIGKGQVLPIVEKALIGKTVGAIDKIVVPPSALAGNPVGDNLIEALKLPKDITLEVEGTILEIQD